MVQIEPHFFSNKIFHSSVALQIVWGYKSMSKSLVHSALQWKNNNANAKKVIEIFFMKLMWSHLQFEKCFINVDCLGKHICFLKNFLTHCDVWLPFMWLEMTPRYAVHFLSLPHFMNSLAMRKVWNLGRSFYSRVYISIISRSSI